MGFYLTSITANLRGNVSVKTLNGRKYLVAPLALITPGVLAGSRGALYYPSDEVSRDPMAWNSMPLVVEHPVENGQPCSARLPHILERQGIGHVFNARITNKGKLAAEGWFDVEKTKAVYPWIYNQLKNNKSIELSTGLFTDNEPFQGVFNGRNFDFIARNYRPDHVAILPTAKGACSINDGCGVLVNELDLVLGSDDHLTANDWTKWNEEHKGQGDDNDSHAKLKSYHEDRIAKHRELATSAPSRSKRAKHQAHAEKHQSFLHTLGKAAGYGLLGGAAGAAGGAATYGLPGAILGGASGLGGGVGYALRKTETGQGEVKERKPKDHRSLLHKAASHGLGAVGDASMHLARRLSGNEQSNNMLGMGAASHSPTAPRSLSIITSKKPKSLKPKRFGTKKPGARKSNPVMVGNTNIPLDSIL